jgi:hypothetical protein
MDHSDNKGLAHWLWKHGVKDLHAFWKTLHLTRRISSRLSVMLNEAH